MSNFADLAQAAADAAGDPWRIYDQWETRRSSATAAVAEHIISDFRPPTRRSGDHNHQPVQGVIQMSSFIMADDEPQIVRAAFSAADRTGTSVTGFVVAQEEAQQTDPKGKKKFMRDGSPLMELRVTIQTREQDDPDDDGRRLLYVKGVLRRAIRDAVLAAGDTDLSNGATVTVTFTGLGKPSKADYNPPRLYAAVYEPPAADSGEYAGVA